MCFLGPEHCVLSIVEGRLDDGIFEILKLLRAEIEGIGVQYLFNSSDLNPKAGDRISILAELRNQPLEPLTNHPSQYSANTTLLFINDVSILYGGYPRIDSLKALSTCTDDLWHGLDICWAGPNFL